MSLIDEAEIQSRHIPDTRHKSFSQLAQHILCWESHYMQEIMW